MATFGGCRIELDGVQNARVVVDVSGAGDKQRAVLRFVGGGVARPVCQIDNQLIIAAASAFGDLHGGTVDGDGRVLNPAEFFGDIDERGREEACDGEVMMVVGGRQGDWA